MLLSKSEWVWCRCKRGLFLLAFLDQVSDLLVSLTHITLCFELARTHTTLYGKLTNRFKDRQFNCSGEYVTWCRKTDSQISYGSQLSERWIARSGTRPDDISCQRLLFSYFKAGQKARHFPLSIYLFFLFFLPHVEVPCFLEVGACLVSVDNFLRCCSKNVGFKFNLIYRASESIYIFGHGSSQGAETWILMKWSSEPGYCFSLDDVITTENLLHAYDSAISWMSWCHCVKPDESQLLYNATEYLVVILQIEQILDSSQEFHADHRSFLLKNLASLKKEKDHWRNFMEKDERNMKTIWEVETAWEKRWINWLFSIYQSAVWWQNDYFASHYFNMFQ